MFKYTTDDSIQTKPVSIPHTTNMLDKNLTIDGDSQSFENPRKHNNSVTAPNSQVPLEYDTLQCQQNTTPHMTYQKLPLSEK